MTPPGLYEWQDALSFSMLVESEGSHFGCSVWQWGSYLFDDDCLGETGIADVELDPAQAKDFVGIAPNTPVEFVYPAAGATIADYLYASDFNPPPDYAKVTYLTSVQEGPQGYSTACEPPNTEGGPRSGGCSGHMEPDMVETVTPGLGSIDGSVVMPPPELAYDASEEGSQLWPFGRLGDAGLTFSYSNTDNTGEAQVGFVRLFYRIAVWLYWEVDQTPPLGHGNITLGTLTRGVRRRVAIVD